MKILYLYKISMFILGCHITIGNYSFTRCASVEIEKSIDTIAQTAKIVIPLTAVLESNGIKTTVETAKAIAVGMPVSITLRYENYIENTEFTGYVKRINYKTPLEIECIDSTYLLQKININKSWTKPVTLATLIEEIVKDTSEVIINGNKSGVTIGLVGTMPTITYDNYSIKNASAAFALQKLKDELGLYVQFLDNNKLLVSLSYLTNPGEVKYTLNGDGCNVINADDLKYHNKEDVRLKVKAVYIKGNNSRTEIEVGDEDGSLITHFFYNIASGQSLEEVATKYLETLKFDGY